MAAELVSELLWQLATIVGKEAAEGVKLVEGAKEQLENLASNLQAIQAVLKDAEKKQVKEDAVRAWSAKLKQISYDIDDVLGEWNTAIPKLKIEKEAGLVQHSSVLAKTAVAATSSASVVASVTIGCFLKDYETAPEPSMKT